jgi:3-dehydroquinate dehydratase-2
VKLLLLHGPNLGRLGERPGDAAGVTLGSVEAAVREEASRHGPVDVRALQSNHEGALLDALHAAHAWAEGVVLNAGVLGRTSWVLREAVACAGVPVVEVELDVPAGAGPTQSLLADVVRARVCGRGLPGYVEAVQLLAGQLSAAVPGRGADALSSRPAEPAGATRGAVSPGGASSGGASSGGASSGGAPAGKAMVPGRPTSPARDCAFCAEEPCELHAGAPLAPPRGGGLGLAGEAMMRLRAFESEALLDETEQSIATLTGRAHVAEVRLAAALSAPTRGEATAGNPAGVTPQPTTEDAERAESKSVGPRAMQAPLPGDAAAVRKSIGPATSTRPVKTLGRAQPEAATSSSDHASRATSRAQLARRIADHLSGALSAAELATYARAGWVALDEGTVLSSSERTLLEPALRQLMFHDRPGSVLDAPALVSLLASLQ